MMLGFPEQGQSKPGPDLDQAVGGRGHFVDPQGGGRLEAGPSAAAASNDQVPHARCSIICVCSE